MQKQKAFVKQLSDAIDACYKAEARPGPPGGPGGARGSAHRRPSSQKRPASPTPQDAASRHLQKAFSLRQRLRACSRPGAFGAFHDAGLPWVEPGVLAIHAQRITGSLTACQSEARPRGCARAARAALRSCALRRSLCGTIAPPRPARAQLKDAQAHLSQLGRLVSDGAAAKARGPLPPACPARPAAVPSPRESGTR